MKLILVGIREGKPVVHWLGVIATSLLVASVVTAGAGLTCFLLDRSFFLLPSALLFVLPMSLCTIVSANVARGLRLPPDQLSPLD